MTLVTLMTILAFIVNIGIFVKTKINLQNAVDAAAWSGAATQARQLTNIGYLNWEMRNIYKEWMFKYYVLGQISLPGTSLSNISPGQNMNFRLKNSFASMGGSAEWDHFNLPAVCIQLSSTNNICQIYSVPGIPRFNNVGVVGVDQAHNKFIDVIADQKAKDCAKRTSINFAATVNWAYGVAVPGGTTAVFPDAPDIAQNRSGAWPKALELAIRIRNVENIVNLPPHPKALSIENIESLSGRTPNFMYERPVKAFWAAFRNLGRNNMPQDSDFVASSFKLTELSPTPISNADAGNLSNLLRGSTDPKHYLDLKLYTLNFVNFYIAFMASQKGTYGSLKADASCEGTKIAVPVPGYPFGFEKNPDVLTYYAVKGEIDFWGIFNPFGKSVKLTAYAAARPFGGRIGPRLFQADNTAIKARERRSFAYASSIKPKNMAFSFGQPIPSDPTFWANPATAIGGSLVSNAPKYVLPNLIYDITPGFVSSMHVESSGKPIQDMTEALSAGAATMPVETAGLFNSDQFIAFKSNAVGADFDADTIYAAINSVRAPTVYEAMNYLIPTSNALTQIEETNIDSAPFINPTQGSGTPTDPYIYSIFAPLFGEGTLFDSPIKAADAINEIIKSSQGGVDTYMAAMEKVSSEMRGTKPEIYGKAADEIYKPAPYDCSSIAGRFYNFFTSGVSGANGNPKPADLCPTNLKTSVVNYWNLLNGDTEKRNYYISNYVRPSQRTSSTMKDEQLMTAFMPGVRQGVKENGIFKHPLLTDDNRATRRNFYSTKFVSMQRVGKQSGRGNFTFYSEGRSDLTSINGVAPTQFQNFLTNIELDGVTIDELSI